MKKHAYLIIAHNQFDLLEILLNMLDDERNDIYLHIDEKVKNFDFDKFKKLLKHSKLFITDRVNVTWGHCSQILCEMTLLKAAVANSQKEGYSYYHLLSGVDLPIKTNDEIYSFFESHYDREFVHFSTDDGEHRIRYYHIFRKKRNLFFKTLSKIAYVIQRKLKVNRLKNEKIVVKKGTNWFSITDKFAKYIVDREAYIAKLFKYSVCGDEVFVQTLLYNSDFKDKLYMPNFKNNQLACARLIDWDRGNPYVFKTADFDEIINSPAMFARKFDINSDKEVIFKIKDYIFKKSNRSIL